MSSPPSFTSSSSVPQGEPTSIRPNIATQVQQTQPSSQSQIEAPLRRQSLRSPTTPSRTRSQAWATCPDCGQSKVEYDEEQGHMVCRACGTVLEENVLVNAVEFAEGEGGGPSTVVGTFVSTAMSRTYGVTGGVDGRGPNKEQLLITAKRKLTEMANSIQPNVQKVQIDHAMRLYNTALDQHFPRGRRTDYVLAVCLYMACRRDGQARLIMDFLVGGATNPFVFSTTLMNLVRKLSLRLPVVDPAIFVSTFAKKLDFGDRTNDVALTALRIVARMKRDWIHQGRRPVGVCGAALMIACRIHGFERTKAEVNTALRIGELTISQRLNEFEATESAKLTVEEFWAFDLPDEADPPAFVRAQKEFQFAVQSIEDANTLALTFDGEQADNMLKEGSFSVPMGFGSLQNPENLLQNSAVLQNSTSNEDGVPVSEEASLLLSNNNNMKDSSGARRGEKRVRFSLPPPPPVVDGLANLPTFYSLSQMHDSIVKDTEVKQQQQSSSSSQQQQYQQKEQEMEQEKGNENVEGKQKEFHQEVEKGNENVEGKQKEFHQEVEKEDEQEDEKQQKIKQQDQKQLDELEKERARRARMKRRMEQDDDSEGDLGEEEGSALEAAKALAAEVDALEVASQALALIPVSPPRPPPLASPRKGRKPKGDERLSREAEAKHKMYESISENIAESMGGVAPPAYGTLVAAAVQSDPNVSALSKFQGSVLSVPPHKFAEPILRPGQKAVYFKLSVDDMPTRVEERRKRELITREIDVTEMEDDPEVANCLLSEDAIRAKTKIWNAVNKRWIQRHMPSLLTGDEEEPGAGDKSGAATVSRRKRGVRGGAQPPAAAPTSLLGAEVRRGGGAALPSLAAPARGKALREALKGILGDDEE